MKRFGLRFIRYAAVFDKLINFLVFIRCVKLSRTDVTKIDLANSLVVELFLIGDIVMSEPVLRALQSKSKNITLLSQPHGRVVLENTHPNLSYISYTPSWAKSTRRLLCYIQNLWRFPVLIYKLRRRRFTVAIDLRGDFRSILICKLAGAKHIVGLDIGGGGALLNLVVDDPGIKKSILDHHDGILKALNCFSSPCVPRLDNRPCNVSPTQILRYPGCHFGASQEIRRFPFREAVRLCRVLLQRNDVVYLLDSPDVSILNNQIQKSLTHSERSRLFLVSVTLADLPALLSQLSEFYCMDSGPSHISAAVGTPTHIFYGPNRAQFVAPRGGNVFLRERSLALSCQPCFNRECKNELFKECLINLF